MSMTNVTPLQRPLEAPAEEEEEEGFAIESGVPIPGGYSARQKYRWQDMKIEDSVFFKGDNTNERLEKKIRGANQAYMKAHGRAKGEKFITRAVEGGVRVWRVK
jgi:hypothetical protein